MSNHGVQVLRDKAAKAFAIARCAACVPPGFPRWRHTYHALPRLVLDYILIRDRAGAVRRARIERLDQDPSDRGPVVFGSDHHPLLGRIDLNPE